METVKKLDGLAGAKPQNITVAGTGAEAVTIEEREHALKSRYSEASSWFQRELSLHERGTALAFVRDHYELLKKAKETSMPEDKYLALFSMAGFEKMTMRKINELIATVAEEQRFPIKDRKKARTADSEDSNAAHDRDGATRQTVENAATNLR